MKRIYLSILVLVGAALIAAPKAHAATFSWSDNAPTSTVGQDSQIVVSVDTQGVQTTGADAVLKFDPAMIDVKSIIFAAPSLYNQNFSNIDTTTGTIKLNSTNTDVATYFIGAKPLAVITYTGKVAGTTTLRWVCTDGETNDTNVVSRTTGDDVVSCGSLTNATLTLTTVANTSTPTPTPTPAPAGCNIPGRIPNLTAKTGPSGTVLLNWDFAADTETYSLQYGYKSGSYQFGVSNIGYTNQFTVNQLSPGMTYYFAVAGVSHCGTGAWSETNGKAGGAATVSRAAGMTATPTLAYSAGGRSFSNLLGSPTPTGMYPTPTIDTGVAPYAQPTPEPSDKEPVNLPWIPIALILIGLFLLLFLYFKRKREKRPILLDNDEHPPKVEW